MAKQLRENHVRESRVSPSPTPPSDVTSLGTNVSNQAQTRSERQSHRNTKCCTFAPKQTSSLQARSSRRVGQVNTGHNTLAGRRVALDHFPARYLHGCRSKAPTQNVKSQERPGNKQEGTNDTQGALSRHPPLLTSMCSWFHTLQKC